MAAALQWYVTKAYIIVPIAKVVKSVADIRPTLSPKFRRPTPSPPRITVKFNHERKVRSLAKKTFGSTLVGSAILLPKEKNYMLLVYSSKIIGSRVSIPGVVCSNGAEDISKCLALFVVARDEYGLWRFIFYPNPARVYNYLQDRLFINFMLHY